VKALVIIEVEVADKVVSIIDRVAKQTDEPFKETFTRLAFDNIIAAFKPQWRAVGIEVLNMRVAVGSDPAQGWAPAYQDEALRRFKG
jgi:hypothetical protein